MPKVSNVFKISKLIRTNVLISIYHSPMAETVVAIARDTACTGTETDGRLLSTLQRTPLSPPTSTVVVNEWESQS